MAEFDDNDVMKSRNLLRDNVLGSASMSVLAATNHILSQQKSKGKGSKVIKRTRKTVDVIFRELGPKNIRKSYRMHKESFWKLHRLLFKSDDIKKRTKQGLPPNGYILNSSRLSMALRWFTGDLGFINININIKYLQLQIYFLILQSHHRIGNLNISNPLHRFTD